jgi:hypothetical protein
MGSHLNLPCCGCGAPHLLRSLILSSRAHATLLPPSAAKNRDFGPLSLRPCPIDTSRGGDTTANKITVHTVYTDTNGSPSVYVITPTPTGHESSGGGASVQHIYTYIRIQ